MIRQPFGRTGWDVPLLSFGAQRIVDEHHCTEEEGIQIVQTALERGITYFDTAPSYSDGQSEYRLGLALQGGRRDRAHIATKTHDRTRDGSLKLLEGSLQRLQTDHVEEWRLHNIVTVEELDAIFAKGGAMEALQEMQAQGVVKKLSISGHTNPQVLVEALRRFDFDSALVALSALDHHIYSFAHEFLPLAREKGVAVVGMKVMALGKLAQWYEKALRYTLTLPIATTIVGMETMEQLERNLSVAEHFTPMDELERLEFWKEIMHLAIPETLPWKAEQWGGDQWYRRNA
ncbi:aldo/keto reductase [Tumebacillus permanentifrigoris]|uniref:Putative aldo/keto reductase-like oxidoreductase n=1 Tax=Tumebacillus permanentifrigoris TaxID=378543 RepID=A0A316D9G3_9BACL|nr:aldo/keto reductase [Tumebacillus permanentifrigoris]PWK13150.1 putative aldo/keto reductase-like oxidoreductase [Tumebacillus permanentifrigoris]